MKFKIYYFVFKKKSTWGTPSAAFTLGSSCPSSHFQNMNIVFDLTFCGGFFLNKMIFFQIDFFFFFYITKIGLDLFSLLSALTKGLVTALCNTTLVLLVMHFGQSITSKFFNKKDVSQIKNFSQNY